MSLEVKIPKEILANNRLHNVKKTIQDYQTGYPRKAKLVEYHNVKIM